MPQHREQQKYNKLLQKAKNDDSIIGFILTGSRGKGVVTQYSDYDVALIATDEKFSDAREEYAKHKEIEKIDIGVMSISGFRNHAAVGSPMEWDRYNYAHLKVQIDKTGEIQKIADEKGILPSDSVKEVCKTSLDRYLNYLYRSLKNFRDGNIIASHLDACESIPPLLIFLFAVEGRVRPYNKYLGWELTNYRLKVLSLSHQTFLNRIQNIIQTGDTTIQKEIMNIVRNLATKQGYAYILDGWKGYYFG